MSAVPMASARTFLFTCPSCGSYQVTEGTARRFLSDTLKSRLTAELEKGALGAELTFKRQTCPRCRPNEIYLIEAAALWPLKIN